MRSASRRAFSGTELLIVIGCIVCLAAVLFLPALAKYKVRSSRIGCANNLKQIVVSFRTWSLDNGDGLPMRVSVTNGGTMELVGGGRTYPHVMAMSNELSTTRILVCPEDNRRNYAINFDALSDSNLSYFVNMDATNYDGASLLCGDRNITNRALGGSRLVPITKADQIGWTKEMHVEKGYLGFGDGSVSLFGNGSAGAGAMLGGKTTNWLAVP